MAEKSKHSIELYPADLQFLESMVQKHQLADVSKAIRCLINYAREEADKESAIFENIRCHNC